MSFFACDSPECSSSTGSVELIVRPARKDLGEFSVARALPASERRMVGPFIFFDHMGPADFSPGHGIQVRPHPHIGIATITYLFEGLVVHRDSLGFTQPIETGAVNLMVAGRGIVHSERAGEDLGERSRLHGIQSWMALPDADLEIDPVFIHYPASGIPEFVIAGCTVRLIIGNALGHESPVRSFVDTVYLECRAEAGRTFSMPSAVSELAIYVVDGEVDLDGQRLASGTMAVLTPGAGLELMMTASGRFMVFGGDTVGHREIWWNFVAPTRARIEQAKDDWTNSRFAMIDGDDEFIPLPD
ncbi:MAG TPA: pirin family protein [Gammaproteobacteria bacterium]|nr:pirin family protein [Gammaproteobacteria bacterium]